MPNARNTLRAGLTASLLAVLALLAAAPLASASRTQMAMFQDDALVRSNPVGTLPVLRTLGVGVIRVTVGWSDVAPDIFSRRVPSHFNATDPGAPAYSWLWLDNIVAAAQRNGIAVDLSVTGSAPLWAAGRNSPSSHQAAWRPDAAAYGRFVQAVGARYSGHFTPSGQSTPLPRVSQWEIWNEPNFGPDLAPQATSGSRVAAGAPQYRSLVDAAWSAFMRSGHGRDTIILGNLDARGQSGAPSRGAPEGLPGNFAATKPLLFVRQLYCVDAQFRVLHGSAAAAAGCPTRPAGAGAFRAAHPALFAAPAFGDHPYPLTTPPNVADTRDPDQAEFSELPKLVRTLDRAGSAYHSGHRFALYNTEYGYITDPPNRSQRFASPPVAAGYINQAEYLSWLQPRLASTMQFLLRDPNPRRAPEYGGFASGLEFYSGAHKAGYDAYRLPVYLPSPSVRRGRRLFVWGAARPAHAYGNPHVQIQYRAAPRGPYSTLATVTVSSREGYFTATVAPRRSGSLRLSWAYPGGSTVYSRSVSVQVR